MALFLIISLSIAVAFVPTEQHKMDTARVYVDLNGGTFESQAPDGWTVENDPELGHDVMWKEYQKGTNLDDISDEIKNSPYWPSKPDAFCYAYYPMPGTDPTVTVDGYYLIAAYMSG